MMSKSELKSAIRTKEDKIKEHKKELGFHLQYLQIEADSSLKDLEQDKISTKNLERNMKRVRELKEKIEREQLKVKTARNILSS